MKIAVYSGSFDPIGLHHLSVARHLLNYVDQVWILPCYESYYGKNLISATHRMRMCELIIRDQDQRIKISDFQIVHKLGKTYEVIKKLRELYPMNDFFVALGIDNALTIEQWYHWKELITEIPFIVVPRKGYIAEKNQWFMNEPHLLIDENTENGGSSSMIRKLIKEKKRISQYVGNNIETYIEENKLYL